MKRASSSGSAGRRRSIRASGVPTAAMAMAAARGRGSGRVPDPPASRETVERSERCEVAGIMEEGVPLGQAYANLEQTPAATALAAPPPEEALPPSRVAQRYPRGGNSPFPSGGYVSD